MVGVRFPTGVLLIFYLLFSEHTILLLTGMNIKTLFSTLFLLTVGTVFSFAQITTQLSQITSESQIVSGRAYKLYYVSNATGCYVKAEANIFSVSDGSTYNGDDADYIFIQESGNWKIKSKTIEKFIPQPTGKADIVPTDNEANAGLWTLNFLQDGIFAPYSGNYCFDRNDGKLYANEKDDKFPRNVNQFKLYEWVATFNTTSNVYTIESNWMLIPAGGIYYYLYNTSTQQFAYPSESGNWTSKSDIAVPLRVVKVDETHYCFYTKDGSKTLSLNGNSSFTITETETSAPSDNIYANLLGGYTKVTGSSPSLTDGWYALQIVEDNEHPEFVGNFLYTLPTPYGMGTIEYPYPVGHGGTYDQHPAKTDATYYFRLWQPEGKTGYYHWQLPNGIYIVNYKNNYPIRYHRDLSDFIIGSNGDDTYYIQSSDFRTKAFDGYIGKTSHKNLASSTKLALYKVDLAGLTPWKVVFNEGADEIPLTCTRDDVQGPTTVYNGGYFFLPTSVTPVPGDFDTRDNNFAGPAVIDDNAKTITVKYAPNVCFIADDVTVQQGSRTTGKGNQKQVLLRTKIVPQAPCTLSSLAITLAGAEQFDQVEAYLTTADQLLADGVSATLLGSKNSGLTIGDAGSADYLSIGLTTNTPVLRMNETYYLWLTADISSSAAEAEIVDAAIISISYKNGKKDANDQDVVNTVDFTSKGDPDGNMRIFKAQSFVKVSTENNGTEAHYYRNPAILNIGANTVLAFYEDRYDNVNGLGKDYDGSEYGHCMDVVVRKSSDNGKTWGDPIKVGTGTAGTNSEQTIGYAGPAVVYNGSKIICLMAAGSSSYDKGLTQIAMSTSTDGTNWTLAAININWGSLNSTSFYVTPGKGVAYSDGHVAFVINAKVGGRLQEYLLYSNADCTTWTVDATPLSGKGKESKLQLKNDGSSLLVMGKTPASKDCNNDLLYFKRNTEEGSSFDGILQTVIWKYENQRLKDMRLYASFDQATTWKELFYIQPGNGATSSMQKLSGGDFNGDLAICFEDGSIGNDEMDGCYTLTYAVIDKGMIAEQSADVNKSAIVKTGDNRASGAPFVNGSGWTKSVVTNTSSGFAGITISANHAAFNREGTDQRYFIIKPSAAGASNEITITAPAGYVIMSYSITGNKKTDENYTLTAGNNTATFNGGDAAARTLSVDNVYSPSTTFTFKSNSNTNSSYSLITDFTITLVREEYGVKLNQVNPGVAGNSYATLYTEYDLQQIDGYTKAYYITEVSEGKAILTETPNEGRDIPKNTAVVLINSVGSTYAEFVLTNGMGQVPNANSNLLKGTLTETTIDLTENSNNYSLGRRKPKDGSDNEWVAGFYKTGDATYKLGANRAYLVTDAIPAEQNVSGLSRGFDLTWGDDDDTTSMADELRITPEEETVETPYYTLDGRRINGKPTVKGIYIKNKKKVIIK